MSIKCYYMSNCCGGGIYVKCTDIGKRGYNGKEQEMILTATTAEIKIQMFRNKGKYSPLIKLFE